MEQKLRFDYSDSCDVINVLESLEKALPEFGVKLEMLDGGDGYEEIRLTKLPEKEGTP